MKFVKIENKKVIYKSPYNDQDRLIEVDDSVCPGMIQNDDGSFSSPPKSNEEKLARIRFERDILLHETDSYALSDRTLSDEMKKYRQDLRDLPASNSDPDKITFPTKP